MFDLHIYYMEYKKGTLIEWVESHRLDEAGHDVLVGLRPVYKCGIIVEDPKYMAVASCSDGRWRIVNVYHDDIKIISETKNG